MSNEGVHRDYRFLDGEAERLALIEDIKQVRQEVFKIAALVPKEKYYEPRYHGWSLGAMLGHLQLMDNLNMWLIEVAIVGIPLPIPLSLLDAFNDGMAQIYRRRVVETTLHGLQKKEQGIESFILRVPVSKFSKTVFDPALQKSLTVEQGLQEFFLYHWRDHLETMRKIDDMHYEPPTESSVA
ncbi:MAG: hypothetical protein ABI690_10265 [Chloroflexota bacterium]